MEIDKSALKAEHVPGFVDFVLEGVYMSRSTIRPRFTAVFLESAGTDVIDFEWDAAEAEPVSELEEVSDIPDAVEGTLTIKDPATLAREKAETKARIRAAFAAADAARAAAEDDAARFYGTYDLSDNESAFTEWMSEDESD